MPPGPIDVRREFLRSLETSTIRSAAEIEDFYRSAEITVRGRDIPKPVLDFNDLNWPDRVLDGFRRQGYTKPTPIQSVGWPIALAGRDLVGIAQTGSGKTLGFCLPAYIHINNQPSGRREYGPMALVLSPTRELAQQTQECIKEFNAIKSVCVFGGSSKGSQIRDIQTLKPTMIVATPGRLIDLVESNIISLANVSYLVLDEADRMLDMGFEPQIRSIISKIPSEDRHTLMWSATWPKEVRAMAEDFLKDYIQVNVGAVGLTANHSITQNVIVVQEHDKCDKLFTLMKTIAEQDECKTIIFAATKRRVDQLVQEIWNAGWEAMAIHGDHEQHKRDRVYRDFKSLKNSILVATDVAARGLDVNDVKFVVNYDYPNCSEDYVHRIGRTGRSGREGTAYTLFTRGNSGEARDLMAVLTEANQEVPAELEVIAEQHRGPRSRFNKWGYGGRGGGGGGYTGNRGGDGGFKRKFDQNGGGDGGNKRFKGNSKLNSVLTGPNKRLAL